jgi:hypothetical protein
VRRALPPFDRRANLLVQSRRGGVEPGGADHVSLSGGDAGNPGYGFGEEAEITVVLGELKTLPVGGERCRPIATGTSEIAD